MSFNNLENNSTNVSFQGLDFSLASKNEEKINEIKKLNFTDSKSFRTSRRKFAETLQRLSTKENKVFSLTEKKELENFFSLQGVNNGIEVLKQKYNVKFADTEPKKEIKKANKKA